MYDTEAMDKDYDWFIEHCAELYNTHRDKMIAYRDGKILGVFDSAKQAVRAMEPMYKQGDYTLQKCSSKDPSSYIINISTAGVCG